MTRLCEGMQDVKWKAVAAPSLIFIKNATQDLPEVRRNERKQAPRSFTGSCFVYMLANATLSEKARLYFSVLRQQGLVHILPLEYNYELVSGFTYGLMRLYVNNTVQCTDIHV